MHKSGPQKKQCFQKSCKYIKKISFRLQWLKLYLFQGQITE